MEAILKYFQLNAKQQSQIRQIQPLYHFWNQKINVVSRQDIENIYQHHVLHSLAISKFVEFLPNTQILDLGTGGGFPGIPLAIMYPDVHFHLVDSIDKKVQVVEAIYKALGLRNITVEQIRAEDIKEKYDFIITRAVADFMILYEWSINLIRRGLSFNDVPNGLIALKGGNLEMELAPFKQLIYKFPIQDYFSESWFYDKYIVFMPLD
ncbi:MAG: 16S rRNA (guanine(527)-N(7))-methyltransferase RsmG [Fimbriimonadaceae bacterium]|nr:16S rRNA (guanine(527)-N(7))-methyltransferase RsmG [Chitinophagales bacterium]